MKKLQLPLSESDVRALRLGEAVALTGTIFTARDAVHKYLAGTPDAALIPDLHGAVLYHCGPVVIKEDGAWRVTAAGPTTSMREEPYMASVIERYSIRGIIGKGGMGDTTAEACRRFGCAYLHTIGGAAQVLASCIRKVPSVHMMDEFGAPEAIWRFDVVEFPAIVTMDAAGGSLHREILQSSRQKLQELLAK